MSYNFKAVAGAEFLACLLVFTTGCATVFKGEYRNIKLDSEPVEAQVFVNGDYYGRTPLRIELRPDQPYVIEFRKDGYQTETRRIKNEIGVG